MKIVQRRYAGPKGAQAPAQGFLLNIEVSGNLPSITEIRAAMTKAGFSKSACDSYHPTSYWK